MRRIGLAACLALAPLTGAAQADDRDYLTAFLEDSLSSAGRTVTVTGFQGLLSARATVEEITIADDQGIWLTLRGVTMDWSRSALLTGQIVVSDLSAAEIVVDRFPVTEDAGASPEAGSFALPELPVSLRVDHLGADHIQLGKGILGSPVEASLTSSMALAGGEGNAQLLLQRTDQGPAGRLALTASFANADQRLVIDLAAEEAKGGIAATLMGLPGAPAASLTIKGDGPLSDFTAAVALNTDGVDRLSGTVGLHGADGGARAFSADLKGDLAPLFVPDYAAFFGDSIALTANGTRQADGRLDLNQFALTARAMDLQGQLSLAADGAPQSFSVTGQIADPKGEPVLLPLPGADRTRIDAASLNIGYDAAKGEAWTLDLSVAGLDRDDIRAETFNLTGQGNLGRPEADHQLDGDFNLLLAGLEPADPMLAAALGPSIKGSARIGWHQGDGALSVPSLTIDGADYGFSAAGHISGLGDALRMFGSAKLHAADLGRFAGIAGQPIGGAAELSLTGSGSALTGAFDLGVDLRGTDLRSGIAQLDGMLRGSSVLTATLTRDTEGFVLHDMQLNSPAGSIGASGKLSSENTALDARLSLHDLSILGGGLRGGLTATGQVSGARDNLSLTLTAKGRNLGLGRPEVDRLLTGDSTLDLALHLRDGMVIVDRANVQNPQLSLQAKAKGNETEQRVSVTGRLNNLALIVPEFPGAVTVSGTLVQTGRGTEVNLTGQGPGQINARAAGHIAPDFRSGDLTLSGTALAGLANPFLAPRVLSGRSSFDLRLNGPFKLASVSGSLNLTSARLADPMLPFSVEDISGRADLSGGRAKINGTGRISTGGQVVVAGGASLTPPFDGDIGVTIRQATIRDPDLFETHLSGNISIKGPLIGGAKVAGRIDLAETEVRVPSTGFSAAGGLPDLQHRYEPHPVFQTRVRAGLVELNVAGSERRRPYSLDLLISSPARLFVRGRGLDAELGGQLRLTGTTDAVVPIGSFDLIRGRLEILSRRLDVTEARLQLEGAFVPYIRFVAQASVDSTMVGVEIEGPADSPEVRFTSIPDLPDEEILAKLLFGSNVQNLSVLQAVELANAVRTLAGSGGEGVVSKLRRNLGLDNLDLKTGANGQSTLTAGRYLTKNIYTELSVDAKGQSEIHLNLDVTRSVTVRGTAASDGTSALGVFVEKDY